MSVKTAVSAATEADEGYADLEQLVAWRVNHASGPLFTTDADPDRLWAAYLDGIPADRRQFYTCHACRRFLQKYGGLVTVGDGGVTYPLLWEEDAADFPAFFLPSVRAMESLVGRAKVTGVFVSSEATWGTPVTGEWTHLSGVPASRFSHPVLSADQRAAELKEEYGMLCRGLAEYPRAAVEQAVRVLEADAVTRAEKALGVARWLADLHRRVDGVTGTRRNNLIWAAVAAAPPGFCHVKATVISTLLDDVVAGLDAESIRRRWADKLNPIQYQRPTAPPKDGAIEQAEKVFAATGAAKSLLRRYATLDDVLAKLWVPRPLPEKPAAGGVFGHLRQNRAPEVRPVELPATLVTWEKFARTVLPGALRLEVFTPAVGSYFGLLTATDPDATPILQWDGLDGHPRNPVSWYFYSGGSSPGQWKLAANAWVQVTAVFLPPHRWQEADRFTHQSDMAMFALLGCVETRASSACLFPEILKSEYHGVRSVIEAHSNCTSPTGAEAGTANGIAFQKNAKSTRLRVRATTDGGPAVYDIDRWD